MSPTGYFLTTLFNQTKHFCGAVKNPNESKFRSFTRYRIVACLCVSEDS